MLYYFLKRTNALKNEIKLCTIDNCISLICVLEDFYKYMSRRKRRLEKVHGNKSKPEKLVPTGNCNRVFDFIHLLFPHSSRSIDTGEICVLCRLRIRSGLLHRFLFVKIILYFFSQRKTNFTGYVGMIFAAVYYT